MKMLGNYINGNYEVKIYNTGTKIRETIDPDDNFFTPEFCESIDIKITNQCDMMCPACHEDSRPDGKHGDILSLKFIETLHPHTELALGGGDPLSHPDLYEFLLKLKSLNIIPNITVNQEHFIKKQEFIKDLISNKLIYGLGISLREYSDDFLQCISQYPNLVLHVINGIVDIEDLKKLANHNIKILILGFKQIRRGKDFYNFEVQDKQKLLYDYLPSMIDKFKVVSFDNLAITQLEVRRLLSKEKWDEFYMGDDGQFTMYCDIVNNEFAKSSVSSRRYTISDDIKDMFSIVKSEAQFA